MIRVIFLPIGLLLHNQQLMYTLKCSLFLSGYTSHKGGKNNIHLRFNCYHPCYYLQIWFIHPLSNTQLDPFKEWSCKTSLSFVFWYPIWIGSFEISSKSLGYPHISYCGLSLCDFIQPSGLELHSIFVDFESILKALGRTSL